jgi:hypothetical protein
MTIVEKLQAIIKYGHSTPYEHHASISLRWYKYVKDERPDDPLNGKMVFEIGVSRYESGATYFYGETLDKCADLAMAYVLARRRESSAKQREEANVATRYADEAEAMVRAFEQEVTR